MYKPEGIHVKRVTPIRYADEQLWKVGGVIYVTSQEARIQYEQRVVLVQGWMPGTRQYRSFMMEE